MEANAPQTKHCRAFGLVGAAAFVSLGGMGLGHGGSELGGSYLAGSGAAPSNTVYVQPSAGGMKMGATVTWTTPSSVMPTEKAVPPLGGK